MTNDQIVSFPFVARVRAIATTTLLELTRSKVFYGIILFGAILLFSSFFLVQLTFQEQLKVIKDVSLGVMTIFLSLLAIVATAQMLPKDVEDRTLYTILAKPVTRFEYLLGKLLGVLALLGIALVLMSSISLAVIWLREQAILSEMARNLPANPEATRAEMDKVRAGTFNSSLFVAILLVYVKSALIASITLFISTISTSFLFSILASSAVYFIGHIQETAREYWLGNASTLWTKFFLAFVTLLFPDLQLYTLADDLMAGNHLPWMTLVKTIGWGFFHASFYVFLAYMVFSKKEL